MKRLLWGYGSSSSYRCQRAGTRRILAAKRTNLVEKGNNKFVLGLQHYFTTTQSTTVVLMMIKLPSEMGEEWRGEGRRRIVQQYSTRDCPQFRQVAAQQSTWVVWNSEFTSLPHLFLYVRHHDKDVCSRVHLLSPCCCLCCEVAYAKRSTSTSSSFSSYLEAVTTYLEADGFVPVDV